MDTIPLYALRIVFGTAIVLVVAGAVLAWRNLQKGRGDRRGATWLATIASVAMFASWIPLAHHVPDPWEMTLFVKALSWSVLIGVTSAVLYLAIEPFARRSWPDAFISLTRLQNGRFRDPLVASHILGGLTASLAHVLFVLLAVRLVSGENAIFLPRVDALSSPAYASGMLLNDVVRMLTSPLPMLVLLVLMRQLTRRTSLAYVLSAIVLAATLYRLESWIYPSPAMPLNALVAGGIVFTMFDRWGVLAWIAWQFAIWISSYPLAASSWYTGRTFLMLALPAAVAAWALWVILTAQRPINEASE